MPPKGSRGLSFDEKQKRTEELKQRMADFIEEMKKQKKETPTREDLQKFFTKGELEAYWNMLTSARKKKSLSVEEAWKGLKAMGKEKADEQRWQTLSDFIRAPDSEEWYENLIVVVDRFEKSRKLRLEKQEYYKGELEMKHGK